MGDEKPGAIKEQGKSEQRLIEGAALAEQYFSLDELEEYAREYRRKTTDAGR